MGNSKDVLTSDTLRINF